jgi:ABC-2 type transport system permease protein
MKASLTIAKRELRSYFNSPIAYIVIIVFVIISGFLFIEPFFLNGRADMREFFSLLPLLATIVIPALTMHVFSEEYRFGSFEIIGTLPFTKRDILLGKFLGSTIFSAFLLAPSLIYAISISFMGDMDAGAVLTSYIGSILLLSAVSSLGICMSALTQHQVVAFMTSALLGFGFTLLDNFAPILPLFLGNILTSISLDIHFLNIARGVLDTRDIIYFLSFSLVFLMITNFVLEEKQ